MLAGCVPGGGVVIEQTGTSGAGTTTGVPTSSGDESGGGGSVSGLPPPPSTTPTTPSTTPSDDTGESEGDSGDAPATGTLVPAHATWRYALATPAEGWASLELDDTAWPEGQAPFGEGGDAATIVDPAAAPGGVFARARFTAAGPTDSLMLYLRRGDGAAVYVNGTEVLRTNLPDGALAAAEDDLGGDEVLRYMQFVVPGDALRAGDNVIAAAVRRASAGAAGLTFDMQVDVHAPAGPPAELKAQWRTRTYGGEYADKNVGAAWVEQEGGGFVRTLVVWGEVRRDNLVAWNAAADGNLVDAVTGATRGSHRTSVTTWDLRDAAGQAAPAGAYWLMLEFTEADSNKGDPPGPRLVVPFEIGETASVSAPPASERYRDVTVFAP